MMSLFRIILLVFFSFAGYIVSAQEICNNGIDDDNDGLIDLNDDDCICEAIMPSSLIPNPSFEDRTCCPNTESELNCAVSWIQASIPTTDYVHTCGILANPFLTGYAAPQPFPDGQGGVGFRDGKPGNSNFKEYVGACLLAPMVAGTEYRIDFYVGFQDIDGSREFNLGLFVGEQCSDLPFGQSSNQFGCPTNGPGYDEIGELFVSGVDEWINVVFEFTAAKDYEVIVLGPACAANPNFNQDPYFYMDNITIAESSEFKLPIVEVTGDLCEGTLVISSSEQDGLTYQWYLDGVALVGIDQQQFTLSPDADEGLYSVLVETVEGCFISDEFNFERISFQGVEDVTICEGDVYTIGLVDYDTPGDYVYDIITPNDCDSLINLTLTVNPTSVGSTDVILCDGETFELYDLSTEDGGIHFATGTNQYGCDSIITVNIELVEPSQGVELDESITVELGETARIEPRFFDLAIETWVWTNEADEVITTENFIEEYLALESETIFVTVADDNGCIDIDSIELRVNKDYTLKAPNIMLIGSNNNGSFKPFMGRKFKSIQQIQIYDRWGNLIFEENNIVDYQNWPGWDGSFNGSPVEIGVYAYIVSVIAIDDHIEVVAGDITVLR